MRPRPCGLVSAVLWIALAACAGGENEVFDASRRQAVRDSARAFFESIPAELAGDGPDAWLRLFDPSTSFFMASDGQVALADRAAAEAFLAGFSPTVARVELVWEDVRIEPLAPGVAVVAAAYREAIVLADGSVSRFGGYVSGVARNRGGSWALQHLHWSSPEPPVG
jgi:hypothetical protein